MSEQVRDYLKRLNETAARMRDVLQSLLEYSRLTSASRLSAQVNLNEIVREVVSDLEPQIQESEAQLDIGILPEIEGDAGQMRQLFQNLIVNALKFHVRMSGPE